MAKKDKQDNKTNAMRILETAGIPYEYQSYECDEFIDGAAVADRLGLPHVAIQRLRTHSHRQRGVQLALVAFDVRKKGIHGWYCSAPRSVRVLSY